MAAVNGGIRVLTIRMTPLHKPTLFAKLNQKLRGYWNYYGIRGNYESLGDYFQNIKT
jgi:hypothetical protein